MAKKNETKVDVAGLRAKVLKVLLTLVNKTPPWVGSSGDADAPSA